MPKMLGRRRLLTVTLMVLLAACGDDDTIADSGRPDTNTFDSNVLPPAQLGELVVFEGHERMVNSVSVPLVDGLDLRSATVRTEASSPVEVVEFECGSATCGVVLKVTDARPNRGAPIPAPIDSENHFLLLDIDGDVYRGLMSVRPLDELTNTTGAPSVVTATPILATRASSVSGGQFVGEDGVDLPFRWVMFGTGAFEAGFELSEGRMGGALAGAAGASAPMDGGAAGTSGGGGGGGGNAAAGGAGQDGAGTGGAGGAERDGRSLNCVSNFSQSWCGGSGGGGGAGAGGAGGGALLLVSTVSLDLTGGPIVSRGGDGTGGGGGGAGGSIIIGGPEVMLSEVDLAGGSGGDLGGTGSAGRLRVDSARLTFTPADEANFYRGPAVDVLDAPAITNDEMVTFTGVAEPGTPIIMRDIVNAGPRFMATTGDDGTFSVTATLTPGLNRFAVEADVDGTRIRSWAGNNVEFGRLGDDLRPLPLGATVDVAYVPR